MRARQLLAGLSLLPLAASALAQTAGTLKWEYLTPGSQLQSSPAVADDGTVYIGVRGFYPGLYAVNPDGSEKWVYLAGDDVWSTPAIGPDSTIYFAQENDEELHAVNPDGSEKWVYPLNGSVYSSPAIGLDGTIYIGTRGGAGDPSLFAVKPDGTTKWTFDTGDVVESPPAIGLDGTIYVATDGQWIQAINPDGTEKWIYDLGSGSGYVVQSSPALGVDGAVYIGDGRKLYALNPDGTLRWDYDTGSPIYSSPAIDVDGTIYIGSRNGVLSAVNPDGSLKWDLALGNQIDSSPAIGADGTVYVARWGGRLHAVGADGVEDWNFSIGGEPASSPAIGPDGTVYVGGYRYLYAVYSDSPGLAESSWPMYRHDLERTARAKNVTIPLTLGETFQIGVLPGQAHYFSLATAAGESLLVEVTPEPEINSLALYGQFRATTYETTQATVRGTYELPIAPTVDGEYLLTVFGSNVAPTGGQYTILADYVDRHVVDVEPRSAGDAGVARLRISGLGFESGMEVELRQGATTLSADEVTVSSASELLARFDLDGAGLGAYDARVIWPDMSWQSLDGAFEIVAGQGPSLEARLVAPEATRPERRYTLWLEYANTGDADMSAPLFSVRSNALLSLDPEAFASQRLEILAVGSSSDPHVLRAGESRRLPIFFLAPQSEDAWFDLHQTVNLGAEIEWAAQKDFMKPVDMDAAEWDALWPDLVARLGTTWADYIAVLRNDARRLAARGAPAHDVAQMIELEMLLAAGDPAAAISGILRHANTNEPLGGIAIRAKSSDGLVIRESQTSSSPPGEFVLTELSDGDYELYAAGYYFDPEVVITVLGEDVNGVELLAHAFPPEEEGEDPETPQHHPAVTTDDSGNLYLVWRQGEEIWWARESSSGWDASGPIPNARGVRPIVVYDAGLLDGGLIPGLFAAWETLQSPKTLQWSVGQLSAEGVVWTEPQALTGDDFDDVGLAATVNDLQEPLVLWLQRDLALEDDTDLYFLEADLAAAGLTSIESPEAPPLETQSATGQLCFSSDLRFKFKSKLEPFKGTHGFTKFMDMCGDTGSCRIDFFEEPGTLTNLFVGNGIYLPLPMEADALNAQWSAQLCPGGTYRVDWVRYEVDGSTGSVPPELYGFEPLLVHFPSLLASVEERFEVYYELYVKYLTAAAQGLLRWDAEMPPKPWNGGQWSQSEGAIFEGSAFGERVGARWLVEGLALFDWSHARPGQRVTVQNYNFCAHLEGETGFGSLGTVLKELVAFAEVDPACSWAVPPSSWTSTSADGEATQEALAVRDVTYSWDALTGTGATYEGNPVLGDVSADLHQDGAPTAAKSPSGEIIVVWTKDVEAAPAGRLGAEVWLSTYEGIGWSSPITLTTEIDFHDNPAAVFDSSGNLMVIWSQASSAGLEYGVGPPEAVVTAMDESRIAFSRRSGDSWSAPATLADSSGPDLYPVIAAGPSGKLTAAWLNDWEGVRTLYAAFWTGSGWLSPTAVVTGGLISNPVVVYPGPDPVLFWAQDEDQDSLTQGDWRIYSSAWDHFFGRWTEPEPVPVPLPEASVAVSEDLPAHGAGSTTRQPGFSTLVPPPPAECTGDCGGPSGCNPPPDVQDQIDEAGSANVGGIDPNEKTGTLGQAEGHYVDAGDRLRYTVYFENLETATAPAQEVFVTDCLPPELDWTTLSLDEVAFGDVIVANPTEQALFQERVTIPDYRPGEAKTWWVDIEPEFDFATGCLEVVLRTLDPDTGELPEDPFAGLLPPEDGSGRGQGHIGFAIAAKADLADGTTIDNSASIVFDTNEAIVTNTWTNTIGEPGDCGPGVFNTLTLADQTLDKTEIFTACQTIIVGPNCHIVAPADVTLRAGVKVEFRSEVSVATGATLTVEIDPALAPP